MVAEPARRWLMRLAPLLPLSGLAATPVADPRDSTTTPPTPSKEMLLYLAEFEDADGQWVDPLEVTREDPDTAKEAQAANPAATREPKR